MELEIKTCNDCPFFSDHGTCELKAKIEKRYMEDCDCIKYVYGKGRLVPK